MTTPHGEQHNSTACFPLGCWSPMYYAWVSSGNRSMSQNCAPHSARHSGLSQTCSMLDTPWNFLGETMAPLCSRTSLVGPLPKGKWRFSWTNHRYGQNRARSYEPNFKRQSNECTHPGSPRAKKVCLHNVLWRWCPLWHMTVMGYYCTTLYLQGRR